MDDGIRRRSEPNVFVKKALQKKWQNLMDRYEYDPSKDYRKDTVVEEKDEQNQATNKKQYSKENITYDKETYDREDVKAKLNEMGGSRYKKMAEESQDKNGPTLFRANEEGKIWKYTRIMSNCLLEKKRFQAKKAIEKQKQAIDNMDDEVVLGLNMMFIMNRNFWIGKESKSRLSRRSMFMNILKVNFSYKLNMIWLRDCPKQNHLQNLRR